MDQELTPGQKFATLLFSVGMAGMIFLTLLALAGALLSGCAVMPPPTTPTQPPVPVPRIARATVWGGGVILPATGTLWDDFGHVTTCPVSNPRLECVIPTDTANGWGVHLGIESPGYVYREVTFVVPSDGNPNIEVGDVTLHTAGFDPSTVPLEQLARIRGAMWTETWPCPLGPRPWQADNVCATDFLWNYSEADRLQIVEHLTSLGYTHAVVGPIVDSDGYHGAWTPNDWRQKFDQFLDMLQFLWDHGLAPVVFIHPDGWTLEQTQALTPLFQSDRAQALIRIVVASGWEPSKYEWSNATWIGYAKWGRETFPHALNLIHTVCDVDAPVGTDSRGDDNGTLPNAQAWVRIAPYLHGWLTQSCTFERKDGITDGRTNFENWVRLFDPTVRGSYADRFQNGYAGWPTFSAWGSTPLKKYRGEYLSYWVFWQHEPKETARQWGDAGDFAIDGYLDGGTEPVGAGDVPWRRR